MGHPWNLFVEGDNLDVLRAMAAAGERVDLVYVDPPYNTGHDFAYRDDFRDADGRPGSRHAALVAMLTKTAPVSRRTARAASSRGRIIATQARCRLPGRPSASRKSSR